MSLDPARFLSFLSSAIHPQRNAARYSYRNLVVPFVVYKRVTQYLDHPRHYSAVLSNSFQDVDTMGDDRHNRAHKTLFLIRHGQSQGQVARRLGLDRRTDQSLVDCPLTLRGESQAELLQQRMEPVDLVVSSPLTRALQTAVIGFPTQPILVHYGLREIGSKIPENAPRRMDQVLHDLSPWIRNRPEGATIDVDTLRPGDWPDDRLPRQHQHIRRDNIHQIFQWLATTRPEQRIAVVCHCGVIQAACFPRPIKPHNAVPIECGLTETGEIVLDQDSDNAVYE